MTFGSPATLDDVPAYMAHVRGGKEAPAELVAEFRRRYALVGGSPLIAITQQQAAATAAELRRRYPTGPIFQVSVGMRHSPPFIPDAIGDLARRGVSEIVAIIMSPQYSPLIMGGYHRAVEEGVAAAERAGRPVQVRVAGAWHRNPHFLDALADRLREVLATLPPDVRNSAPVLLTCHSLPQRVVEKEPDYLVQIDETVRALVARVELADGRWQFAYQSAGHTPEEWLKPDMKDLLPGLRDQGHRHVVMAPVQFLADHLEILYDIDVAAREDAERLGLAFHRIESLNVSPKFIAALADVVDETTM
jgi:ferrochelatase